MENQVLYVFIDESGDFNFSPNGTKYYTFTAVVTDIPWNSVDVFIQLKHSLLTNASDINLDQEYTETKLCNRFHASEDKQLVRDQVFDLISKLAHIKAYSIVIQKNKTYPSLQNPVAFYPKCLGSLLSYIFKSYTFSKICIFVDGYADTRNKKAFAGAIKSEIRAKLPTIPFCIYHPSSTSDVYLQIVDYINWAVFKKWESGDVRSYDLIKHLFGAPELDYFKSGNLLQYRYKK